MFNVCCTTSTLDSKIRYFDIWGIVSLSLVTLRGVFSYTSIVRLWNSDNSNDNLPHAYSDVIRAGLTPKLRDTNILCQIVDYVAQQQSVLQNKRLISYSLGSRCWCLVSPSDITGAGAFFVIIPHSSANIIEMIVISKRCDQCIYILDEETKGYGDANNDNENYEHDNNENRENKVIPIDGSNDITDVHASYNNKEGTLKYDAKARSISDNFNCTIFIIAYDRKFYYYLPCGSIHDVS